MPCRSISDSCSIPARAWTDRSGVLAKCGDQISEDVFQGCGFHAGRIRRRCSGGEVCSSRVPAPCREDSRRQGQRLHVALRRRHRISRQRVRPDGKKVLVIFTDGDDTSSSRRWDEALRLFRASDVTVYPIGFLSISGFIALDRCSRGSMEIAWLTGGRAVFPGSMKKLDPMVRYDCVRKFKAKTCWATYPTNTSRDGKWRKVEIKLKRPPSERAQLRTREGYFAPVKYEVAVSRLFDSRSSRMISCISSAFNSLFFTKPAAFALRQASKSTRLRATACRSAGRCRCARCTTSL